MSLREKAKTPAEVVKPLEFPSILCRLAGSCPEYLRSSKSNGKKSEIGMMKAAVEEILGDVETSCIDWTRVEELQQRFSKGSKSPQLEYCIQKPIALKNGVKVHILGVVHSSEASALNLQKAIEQLSVKCVALESDLARTEARRKFQLPLLEKFKGSWAELTDLKDQGGQGSTFDELVNARLVNVSGNAETAQFLAACGSVGGMPELTAIYETVFDTYLRLVYGQEAVSEYGVDQLDSTVAYRLAFTPDWYFLSHIFLRDVFMAYKIAALSRQFSEGDTVLAVVGGVHVEGIRALLTQDEPPCDIHALACCFVDAEVPSSDEVDEIRDELLKRIFVQGQVQEWDDAGQCWKVINVEAACGEAAGDDQEADDHSARDRIHYGELLLEGRINPYPIGITEAQSTQTDAKTVSQSVGQDIPPSKRQRVCGGGDAGGT
ncbi:hypothetical protein Pmar_PMAR003363 [Perkinsus marinus ATCC 50983]|uniref:TraB domain-containing protein n=1 Tax=Perkinsus marinus (strain ATCC 50983 / TXsc) TaxID=423536 RepID=C5KH44_PERM5|nr:hypothetical protein Pmar_PMAR003363 [Perkinsus marinus ATCC 50983]EER15906.1 hypothetical protein Pmar_PMAR003363 [Perkinsus marinus ATCC 50983]|eukprot:XP_002784110.1 hypothetical protein Pmar_PMAR003363 [Perkinsus marinus ATCC 50983]